MRGVVEGPDEHLVRLQQADDGELQAVLVAELLDHRPDAPQVVSRDAREQVMLYLQTGG